MSIGICCKTSRGGEKSLLCFKNVDDTYTVLFKGHAQEFQNHLEIIDDDIEWMTEGEVITQTPTEEMNIGTGAEPALAFLETWSVVNDDGSIETKVYCKETHKD